MQDQEVRVLIDSKIRHLRWALGLQDWGIDVLYGKLEPGVAGLCSADPKYREATITLDPTEMKVGDRRTDPLNVLLHEMTHVLHAEFECYRQAAMQLAHTKNEESLLDTVWEEASEKCRLAFGRFMQSQGCDSVDELISRSKNHATDLSNPDGRGKVLSSGGH